jgi:hypothetical protein
MGGRSAGGGGNMKHALDPDCKRYPEVCGEVARHHDANSAICQLPNGHAGEHDWALSRDDGLTVVENPTLEERIERCERAIAEMQRALHAMGIFAPSRELDLIDLP